MSYKAPYAILAIGDSTLVNVSNSRETFDLGRLWHTSYTGRTIAKIRYLHQLMDLRC